MTDAAMKTARELMAKARGIERNIRLGRYNGRNALATSTHLTSLYGKAAVAESDLTDAQRGLLWAEHDLAARVSLARDQGQDRPELRARLTTIRRELRQEETR